MVRHPRRSAYRHVGSILVLWLLSRPAAAAIRVCPVDTCATCTAPCSISVPILVTGTGRLDAVGFDLDHLPWRLQFSGMRRGRVTRDWTVFEAQAWQYERVRIGGFDSEGYSLNGADTLCVLQFEVIPDAVAALRAHNFVDDFAGARECTTFVRVTRPAAPPNGHVAVVPANDPTACCYATPDGTTLNVVARAPEGTVSGILGAAFRVQVSPPAPGAVFAWTPAPGLASSIGDPVDNDAAPGARTGVTLAFESCASFAHGEILLGTLTVFGLTGERDLLVRRHDTPPPAVACPSFRLCEPCAAAAACLSVGDAVVFRARINAPSCDPVLCGWVPVAPTTWSAVKQTYR